MTVPTSTANVLHMRDAITLLAIIIGTFALFTAAAVLPVAVLVGASL